MIETIKINNTNLIKIKSFFTNEDVIQLLQQQINQLQQFKEQFIYTLTAQNLHLFLYFHHRIHTYDEQNGIIKKVSDVEGQYAIKITKSFPISGLRVHIMNNNCVPRLLDCRDISQEILGEPWNYKYRLKDLFKKICEFQGKLKLRNLLFLPMQKTGQFKIGDIFDIHELKKFKALQIFQDLTNPQSPILGITQTHFLTFKQIPQIQNQKNKQKYYQLYRACQLQCICEVFHRKKVNQLIITFNIYNQKINFTEPKKTSKKYKLEDTQLFIRNILKNIVNFQKIQINLQLNTIAKQTEGSQKIIKKLQDSKFLQQKYRETHETQLKKEVKQQLVKCYHKLIEYFSQRSNSYYLIFISKLNQLTSSQ